MPRLRLHTLHELDQRSVARRVAVGVVQLLEVVDVEQDGRELASLARDAREVLFDRLPRVAAVVDPGQAVRVCEPRNLVVIAKLDLIESEIFEDGPTDADEVAVRQLALGDALTSHKGPVLRPPVTQDEAGVDAFDLRVMARHARVVERDAAGEVSADADPRAAQQKAATERDPFKAHEVAVKQPVHLELLAQDDGRRRQRGVVARTHPITVCSVL